VSYCPACEISHPCEVNGPFYILPTPKDDAKSRRGGLFSAFCGGSARKHSCTNGTGHYSPRSPLTKSKLCVGFTKKVDAPAEGCLVIDDEVREDNQRKAVLDADQRRYVFGQSLDKPLRNSAPRPVFARARRWHHLDGRMIDPPCRRAAPSGLPWASERKNSRSRYSARRRA
jgi:hypothetical protein